MNVENNQQCKIENDAQTTDLIQDAIYTKLLKITSSSSDAKVPMQQIKQLVAQLNSAHTFLEKT
jgi:hypothetical protein